MSALDDARVVLLRHGETSWSTQRRHTGRTDLPLTERGEEQARAAGGLLATLELRNPLVRTSPRLRAMHTAELAGLTGAVVDDDLAEWDYGAYEGLTTPQIRESVPGWTIWTGPVPDGETAQQVRERADRVLAGVTAALPERDIVLVGHGHFSRALIARWAEFEIREGRRFAMSTGGLTVLGYEHDARAIRAHNLVPNGASQ
ncbi:acid phosphatase [Nocardia implantans]|uniref:Acid phosphatase n=1 Tax=Nocardia implantans TaxID=3108168 RepID=A0ABU6B288_9NOCA|nr:MULTISPECIES: acid phosphatase [unclassified Nocardia]MBF6194884.1 acid phosphatase [Nocardia beijingensis]MEA3530458.1 acid phosphatase [Nocardia sp. CDC192]MEB3513682.1 acid phosphatase [Nocardia sp. CDC186]